LIRSAKLTLLTADSIKAALDIYWDDEEAQMAALQTLLSQVDALERWVARRAAAEATVPPLKDSLAMLRRLVEQDIEPDPSGTGRRIKQEVAKDRLISVADPEMGHGRKSKSKLFNGYKRHIAIANGMILATAVVPANVQEHAPAAGLLAAAAAHGDIEILDIDRGYLSSPAVAALHGAGTSINSRPWRRPTRDCSPSAISASTFAAGRSPARTARPRSQLPADRPTSPLSIAADASSNRSARRRSGPRSLCTRSRAWSFSSVG
jgi:Transposase DDE domain